jgi:hypothetical protein
MFISTKTILASELVSLLRTNQVVSCAQRTIFHGLCFRLIQTFPWLLTPESQDNCKFKLDIDSMIFKHHYATTSNQEVSGEGQKGCLGNIEVNMHPRRTKNE